MHENVQRALEKGGASYIVHRHADLSASIRSPQDFARALGYNEDRITKSLFLRCLGDTDYGLVVCSSGRRIKFNEVANYLECKRVQVASRSELLEHTGYPSTGVSPLGLNGIRVLMDEDLFRHETILIGGGLVGVEVEISPDELREITNAGVGQFTEQ